MNGAERPTGNSPGSPDRHSGPVCVCVWGGGGGGGGYVVYEDTNLYNDMGMTLVLQGEGDL